MEHAGKKMLPEPERSIELFSDCVLISVSATCFAMLRIARHEAEALGADRKHRRQRVHVLSGHDGHVHTIQKKFYF